MHKELQVVLGTKKFPIELSSSQKVFKLFLISNITNFKIKFPFHLAALVVSYEKPNYKVKLYKLKITQQN